MKYKQVFKNALLSEDGDFTPDSPLPVDNTPAGAGEEPIGTDSDAWADSNPDIAGDDKDLGNAFSVEGLDRNEIEKYSETIRKWGIGIQGAIDQLGQVIKFTANEKLNAAPGSEQFNALIKTAPNLKKDLAGFKSQVEDLEEIVKLAINDDRKERRAKSNG